LSGAANSFLKASQCKPGAESPEAAALKALTDEVLPLSLVEKDGVARRYSLAAQIKKQAQEIDGLDEVSQRAELSMAAMDYDAALSTGQTALRKTPSAADMGRYLGKLWANREKLGGELGKVVDKQMAMQLKLPQGVLTTAVEPVLFEIECLAGLLETLPAGCPERITAATNVVEIVKDRSAPMASEEVVLALAGAAAVEIKDEEVKKQIGDDLLAMAKKMDAKKFPPATWGNILALSEPMKNSYPDAALELQLGVASVIVGKPECVVSAESLLPCISAFNRSLNPQWKPENDQRFAGLCATLESTKGVVRHQALNQAAVQLSELAGRLSKDTGMAPPMLLELAARQGPGQKPAAPEAPVQLLPVQWSGTEL